MQQIDKNQVKMIGTLAGDFIEEETTEGEKLYHTFILMRRRSEVIDNIMIVVNEDVLNACKARCGQRVRIRGELRVRPEPNRLRLYVYVQEMYLFLEEHKDKNDLTLCGILYRTVNARETIRKKTIVEFQLLTYDSNGKHYVIPCIGWGSVARIVDRMIQGSKIAFKGRIQSREYLKRLPNGESEERETYEISVMKLI